MNGNKFKEEEDYLRFDDSCFVCLEPIYLIKQEQFKSLNFLLNYLKISTKAKLAVCEKCEENVERFGKLCDALEKVRMEMDYLLDLIQSGINNSTKDNEPASNEFTWLRENFAEKCKDKIYNRKPEILLKRIDLTIKVESQALDCSEDWSPELDNDSSSSHPDNDCSATPVISEINDIKTEISDGSTSDGKQSAKTKPTCTKCSKTFSNNAKLKTHINTIHLQLKPFKCSKCPLLFGDKQNLRQHFKVVHLNLKPHKCDICGKSFSRADSLQLHKAIPHNPETKVPETSEMFSCGICEKTFNTIESLKNHEKVVHTKKLFTCDICTKSFKTRTLLKRHVSAVHEKRRHYCQAEGCGTSYTQLSHLLSHYKLEHPSTTLPWKCSRSSYYSERLEKGEILIECKLCRGQFKSVEEIRTHVKAAHGSKIFPCGECGYSASLESRLQKHIEHKHKSKQVKNEVKEIVKSENNTISDEYVDTSLNYQIFNPE